jgi:hypothetical protein
LPVFLLNLKGDTEIALKQREGSALRYRYLRLFGIPVIPISKSFIADLDSDGCRACLQSLYKVLFLI